MTIITEGHVVFTLLRAVHFLLRYGMKPSPYDYGMENNYCCFFGGSVFSIPAVLCRIALEQLHLGIVLAEIV